MSLTAAWTHRGGTGTTGGGRCPYPLVIDAGSPGNTTSTHTHTSALGSVGIRFDENQWTGVTYTSGAGATRTLSKTNLASTLSWEQVSMGTFPVAVWTTAGAGDVGAFYHDNTGIHGKPIAVRLNGATIVEGTLGSLADEQWAFGDVNSLGSNRVYIQSALVTPTVEAIYGDGTHIRLSSAAGPITLGWYEVETVVDKDTIKLKADAAPNQTPTDVICYQNVNPFLDLEYIWSVSPTTAVEAITNGDQRPSSPSTTIDSYRGYGPIWAFVFKEGCTSAVVTLTINDLVNGDTTSKTFTFTETSWSGSTIRYIASTGDNSDGTTLVKAWTNPTTGYDWLRTATAPAELIFLAGDTVTQSTDGVDWTNITGDRRIRTTVAGTKATVNAGAGVYLFIMDGDTNSNFRMMDLDLNKTGSIPASEATAFKLCGQGSLLLRCNIDCNASTISTLQIGTGSFNSPDSVVWDCYLSNSHVNGEYALFSGGNANIEEVKRRAVIGTKMEYFNGCNFSMFRDYSRMGVTAYCELKNATTGAGHAFMRLNAGNQIAQYKYYYANYCHRDATPSSPDTFSLIKADATSIEADITSESILYDSNYYASSASTVANEGLGLIVSKNTRVQNGVFINIPRVIGDGLGGSTLRLFNISTSGTHTGGCFLINDTSISNLKILNTAGKYNSSNSTSNIVGNPGVFGTVPSLHMKQNIWDWGSVQTGQAWQAGAAFGGFASNGWPTQTNKGDQLNYSGNQGKDNDPSFTGANNLLPSGGSSCIGTAYLLDSVPRDIRGYVPASGTNRDDVGAFQVNGVSPYTGGGGMPPVTGSPAARFRCVGLRR